MMNHTLRMTLLGTTAMLFGLGLVAPGCDGDGELGQLGTRIRTVTGKLVGAGGQTVKLGAMVDGKLIPATLKGARVGDGKTGVTEFSINDLPAGAKTLVAEIGGQTRTFKFPRSKQAKGSMAAMIPETQVTSETIDLGAVSLTSDGHMESENNPFETNLDTDGDGTFDYYDEDLDGDGQDNLEDLNMYGDFDEYADWGFDEEMLSDLFAQLDGNGDGVIDLDEVFAALESFNVCADDDIACWEELLGLDGSEYGDDGSYDDSGSDDDYDDDSEDYGYGYDCDPSFEDCGGDDGWY